MKSNMFSKKIFLILLVLALPAFSTLIRPGYLPMHDDIQGMRLLQMGKCMLDGQIPCRWVPDMGYGYGYPQFSYYAPLAYYAVVPLVLLGGSVLESIKVMFALSVIAGSLGMYLLGSYYWGKRGGILAALFYVYAPYRAVNMYVRGAVGEFWGMIFLPFIFYFTLKVLDGKKKNTLFLALSVAGLLLSHNITAMMILPFYILFILASKKISIKKLVNLAIGGAWGVGMAAFFVLPAFFEKQHVHVETILQGYFNYLAHFVSLKQIFLSTFWGYGVSTLGTLDGISLTVGILHWAIPILSLAMLLYFKKIVKAKTVLMFMVLGLLALFMTHNKSVFLWDNIGLLAYVQFPWRFLAIATFFFSISAGALISTLSQKTPKSLLVACFFVVLLLFYGSFFKPQRWLDISDAEKFSGESWQQQQTISIFDYLPIAAFHPPTSPAAETPEILNSDGVATLLGKGTNWQSLEVNIYGERASVRLAQFDFPGWEVKVDDKPVNIDNDNELGLITFEVTRGVHSIEARLKDTSLRLFSNLVSLIAILIIPVYYKKLK